LFITSERSIIEWLAIYNICKASETLFGLTNDDMFIGEHISVA